MTNPEKPNVVNYSHVDETSYFFSKIEEVLEWLKYYPNATAGLILRLNNTLKQGYQIEQSAPVKPEECIKDKLNHIVDQMQTKQNIASHNMQGEQGYWEGVHRGEYQAYHDAIDMIRTITLPTPPTQ